MSYQVFNLWIQTLTDFWAKNQQAQNQANRLLKTELSKIGHNLTKMFQKLTTNVLFLNKKIYR